MASWSQVEHTLRSTLWQQPVSAVMSPWGWLLLGVWNTMPMCTHQAHYEVYYEECRGTGGHIAHELWLGPVWNLSLEEGAPR